MGVWGSCPSVGNIIGAYAVSHVLSYGYQVTKCWNSLCRINDCVYNFAFREFEAVFFNFSILSW